MAAVIRFVDVNSAAGGNGTTDATAGANRAYSSRNEMEAAEQTDLPTDGDTFECRFAGGVDSSISIFVGWTTGASNGITLTTTIANRHVGVFDASKYNVNSGTGIATPLDIREEFVSVIGLQFERESVTPSSSFRNSVTVSSVAAGTFVLHKNIFKSSAPDITGEISGLRLNDSSIFYSVKNNIFYDYGGTNDLGISTNAGSPTGDYYNNTFINCTGGIEANSNIPITNCIFQDCTTDIVNGPNASSDFNLTDNVSIIGSNSVTSSTLTFENKAADNFALAAGDTDAIGAGVGPSTDSSVPTDDIIGTARSGTTTDIGAFMFVGSGITVTGATATYNYDGISGTVDLTGLISVTGATASFDYDGVVGIIDLTAEILVTGQTASYDYDSISGTVDLSGLITVTGQTATYDYDGIAGDIILQGQITVTGSTANYDYNALNGTIILKGPITVNPKNIIRVARKSNTVRVNRKSNVIRVK